MHFFTPFWDSRSVGLKLCEPGQVSPLFKASQSFPTALRINLLSSARPLRCCLTQSLLPLQHWPGILFHSLTTLQPYQPPFCHSNTKALSSAQSICTCCSLYLELFLQLPGDWILYVPTWMSPPQRGLPWPTESATLRMVWNEIHVFWQDKKNLNIKKFSLPFGLLSPPYYVLCICIRHWPNLPHQQKFLLTHKEQLLLRQLLKDNIPSW